jgi:hypothetical protein
MVLLPRLQPRRSSGIGDIDIIPESMLIPQCGEKRTMHFETLSSDRIGIAMDLEADRMSNLLLDPQETLAEQDVVMEERRMQYDVDPRIHSSKVLLQPR